MTPSAVRRSWRTLAAASLLLATTACGGSSDAGEDAGPQAEAPDSQSESQPESESVDGSTPSPSVTTSASTDASACTGETQEVEGAQGVTLTVPADWSVETFSQEEIRLEGPDGDTVEAGLIVQQNAQTIEDGVLDVERLNSEGEKTAEEEIELPGFESARSLSFTTSLGNSAYVVGVAQGSRVIAYALVDADATDEEPLAFGCMRTLQR